MAPPRFIERDAVVATVYHDYTEAIDAVQQDCNANLSTPNTYGSAPALANFTFPSIKPLVPPPDPGSYYTAVVTPSTFTCPAAASVYQLAVQVFSPVDLPASAQYHASLVIDITDP